MPLLFSIFINDLNEYIEHSSVIMYVDDTVIFVSSESKEDIESNLNHDWQNLLLHFRENEFIINLKSGKPKKTFFGNANRLTTVAEKIEVLYNH